METLTLWPEQIGARKGKQPKKQEGPCPSVGMNGVRVSGGAFGMVNRSFRHSRTVRELVRERARARAGVRERIWECERTPGSCRGQSISSVGIDVRGCACAWGCGSSRVGVIGRGKKRGAR